MGLITKTLKWITHPAESEGTIAEWAAGLVVVLVLAFLWSTTLKQIS